MVISCNLNNIKEKNTGFGWMGLTQLLSNLQVMDKVQGRETRGWT